MGACNYCGRENRDAALFCSGCGTALRAEQDAGAARAVDPPPPPRSSVRRLDARSATTILLAYLVVQALCGVLLGVVAGILVEMRGMQSLQQGLLLIDKSLPE